MKNDPVFEIIKQEETRQSEGLELIPSENYVSAEVLKAMGSVLTNKYSEGYLASVIMVATKTSTKSRTWQLNVPRNCSMPTTPMCSHILVPTPTRQCILLGVSLAIRFSLWLCQPAGT